MFLNDKDGFAAAKSKSWVAAETDDDELSLTNLGWRLIDSMTRPKFFRDPVHVQLRFDDVPLLQAPDELEGSARRSWLLRNLIDSPDLQRLRSIRQNGLTNLVFHGAEHTRFTHSLGVCHLSSRMYESIVRNCSEIADANDEMLISAAGLLHDVGHGPFSHTLEEILEGIGKEFDHEVMTVRFMKEDTEINRILRTVDDKLPDHLAKFFDKSLREDNNWMYRIVSSQMDADRLDYLLRDTLFTGVKGAGFDLDRILDLLYHHEQSIAVEIGALEAVEGYLFTLDQMYRIVYYHHAVRAATQGLMVAVSRAVHLYVEGDKEVVPALYPNGFNPLRELVESGDEIPIESYVRLGEFQLWQYLEIWSDYKDAVLADLAKRVLRRDLFKTVEIKENNYKKK